MGSPHDHGQTEPPLREPKTPFQIVVRKLAEVAMSVTHHDASDDEPGYIHEVRQMELKFTNILRGKLFPRVPTKGDRAMAVKLTKAQIKALKMVEKRDWPAGEPRLEWINKPTARVLLAGGFITSRPACSVWGRLSYIADLTDTGRRALQEQG